PAASVRSEPGSNSQVENSILTKSRHSESTRTHTHHLPHRCDNNEVYSLVQNVTVKVYSRDPNSFRPRKLRRPRFSFFSYSIVKKQTVSNSHKIIPPKPKPRETNKLSAHPLDFFRTKVVVASSAAALVQ
ncbi:hypothetical protein, partial [Agrobacterium tumefaciens]|uniref:hypothetical protein n=4 Tax=Agrobacterium tumefaciens TaxID=358 RepID=UPI001AEC3F06